MSAAANNDHFVQPASFAFNESNLAEANKHIAKYPKGRQASAVMPLLWLAQYQEGWVSRAAMDVIAGMLDMAPIRVYEVATFYTMYSLKPKGTHLIQVCRTTPCWLRGSDGLTDLCKKKLGIGMHETSRGRQVHPDGSRMPRRLRERADGADQRRLLRRPDAGDAVARCSMSWRPAASPRSARRSIASTRRRSAA